MGEVLEDEDEKYLELANVPVDTRGHRQVYNPNSHGALDGKLVDANIFRVNVDEPLISGFASVHSGVYSCANCDTYPGFTVVENAEGPRGIGLRAKSPCAVPNGVEASFRFVVKSGRIIVAHDLRPVFDVDLPYTPGYSSSAGQAFFAQKMAAIGVATGITSNGGRELMRLDDDLYGIVSHDDEFPEYTNDASGHISSLGYASAEKLADVSGGVCAYAIADYDHWASTAIARGLDPAEVLKNECSEAEVIDFPKGVYWFTNHSGRAGFEDEGGWPTVYTTFSKISVLTPSILKEDETSE